MDFQSVADKLAVEAVRGVFWVVVAVVVGIWRWSVKIKKDMNACFSKIREVEKRLSKG
jgi:hypothetical protein